MANDINIKWLKLWDSICTDPASFESELNKEIGEGHILYGKTVSSIGRRYDRDAFLFQIHDSEFCLAVVHLTYSCKKEENPKFPLTKLYKDLDDWINNCMLPDHEKFLLVEEE